MYAKRLTRNEAIEIHFCFHIEAKLSKEEKTKRKNKRCIENCLFYKVYDDCNKTDLKNKNLEKNLKIKMFHLKI